MYKLYCFIKLFSIVKKNEKNLNLFAEKYISRTLYTVEVQLLLNEIKIF